MGKLFIPAADGPDGYTPPTWLADFEQELLLFPLGKHDDQVDALSIVGRMLDQMVGAAVPEAASVSTQDDYGFGSDSGGGGWKTA
jgi:hypothetical protein